MNRIEIEQMEDLLTKLNKAINMISIVAFHLKGEDRKDALAIRKMMKELRAKVNGALNFNKPVELMDSYGAIVLGLAILYSTLADQRIRDDVVKIQHLLSI
ncbi:hypothetical protein [Metallosphaera hakonensis]|uniref:Uncharacterized protein n=1 Tax=Metallosphaera hakonensis JCM 8857 = DSM 7519 TaxID=1293036 RepID=A0A2U9IRV5_9CREN|nr:hypothetical protein [Metallosphaera hakonensis]AWR98746.1 hypothetical protein DFR87_02525 [Metallosphaera hakonensis JCM 8857 = DSM 7519]